VERYYGRPIKVAESQRARDFEKEWAELAKLEGESSAKYSELFSKHLDGDLHFAALAAAIEGEILRAWAAARDRYAAPLEGWPREEQSRLDELLAREEVWKRRAAEFRSLAEPHDGSPPREPTTTRQSGARRIPPESVPILPVDFSTKKFGGRQ
jgi:hypothetical protein